MGPMVRWEPTTTIQRLRDEMNRLIQDFFGEVGEERVPTELTRVPTVDILDRGNDLLVRAELPGVDKDNIRVEATPEAVLIHAEGKKEAETREENYVRRERRVTTYQRVVPLPVEA